MIIDEMKIFLFAVSWAFCMMGKNVVRGKGLWCCDVYFWFTANKTTNFKWFFLTNSTQLSWWKSSNFLKLQSCFCVLYKIKADWHEISFLFFSLYGMYENVRVKNVENVTQHSTNIISVFFAEYNTALDKRLIRSIPWWARLSFLYERFYAWGKKLCTLHFRHCNSFAALYQLDYDVLNKKPRWVHLSS